MLLRSPAKINRRFKPSGDILLGVVIEASRPNGQCAHSCQPQGKETILGKEFNGSRYKKYGNEKYIEFLHTFVLNRLAELGLCDTPGRSSNRTNSYAFVSGPCCSKLYETDGHDSISSHQDLLSGSVTKSSFFARPRRAASNFSGGLMSLRAPRSIQPAVEVTRAASFSCR